MPTMMMMMVMMMTMMMMMMILMMTVEKKTLRSVSWAGTSVTVAFLYLRSLGREPSGKGAFYYLPAPRLKERSLRGSSSPFCMRFAEHLTALRAWCCKECLPCRRKPDVLRPRVVGVRGSMTLKTTAMYDMLYTFPPIYVLPPAAALAAPFIPPPPPPPAIRACFGLGTRKVGLVGENPTCSVPAL